MGAPKKITLKLTNKARDVSRKHVVVSSPVADAKARRLARRLKGGLNKFNFEREVAGSALSSTLEFAPVARIAQSTEADTAVSAWEKTPKDHFRGSSCSNGGDGLINWNAPREPVSPFKIKKRGPAEYQIVRRPMVFFIAASGRRRIRIFGKELGHAIDLDTRMFTTREAAEAAVATIGEVAEMEQRGIDMSG